MHEWGITKSIVESIVKGAQKHDLKRVDKVRLSIGESTELTPESLEFCFQCLSKGTVAERATLEIRKSQGREITIDSLEGEREGEMPGEDVNSHEGGTL